MTDRVCVDPEVFLGVEVAGTQGDRPLVGGVQVVHREVEVQLLLHGGVGPRRGHEAGGPLERDGRAAAAPGIVILLVVVPGSKLHR